MVCLSLVGTHKLDTTLERSGLDFRGVSNYILSHRQADDAVIFYNFGGNWTWEYYVGRARKAGDSGPVPPTLFPLAFDRASIVTRTAPYRRVWVALQQDLPTPQSDANNAVLVQTMREHFHLAEEKEFAGESLYAGEEVSIHLALYSAPAPQNSP